MIKIALVLIAFIAAGFIVVTVSADWVYDQLVEGVLLNTYPQFYLIQCELLVMILMVKLKVINYAL